MWDTEDPAEIVQTSRLYLLILSGRIGMLNKGLEVCRIFVLKNKGLDI